MNVRIVFGAVTAAFVCCLCVRAESPVPTGRPSNYPAWWFERDVIERTTLDSTPVYPADYPSADDYAVLLQGQLKSIGCKAYAEMQSALPGSIWLTTEGAALTTMVNDWLADATAGDNYAAINAGQLKTVATKFYDALKKAGYVSGNGLPPTTWTSGDYPWTESTSDDDNYAVTLLGQTKNLFSFDLKRSADGDQIPDWWEHKYDLPSGNNNGSDTDGDGVTDLDEYTAWTNPRDYYSRPTELLDVRIVLVSGNNQESENGAYLTYPLVLKVVAGPANTILTNAPVHLAVANGDGGLSLTSSDPNPAATLDLVTDGSGLATVYYKQGATINSTVQIDVTAGSAPAAHFTVHEPSGDVFIAVVDGDKQGVKIGDWTWGQITVRAKSGSGIPIGSASLDATVDSAAVGGMAINKVDTPVTTLPLLTDENGEAQFWFKSGSLPGVPTRIYVQDPSRPESQIEVLMAVRDGLGLPLVTDGLKAWYSGEYNTNDHWGLNHATNNGALFAQGAIGYAFDFDGLYDHLLTPIPDGGERTLVAWINPRNSEDVAEMEGIVEAARGEEGGTGLGIDEEKITAELAGHGWSSEQSITLNEWQQLALVVTSSEAKLYLNGALVDTELYTPGTLSSALYKVGAGFDGLIDEVGIYERALSATEVEELYEWASEVPVADPKTIEVNEDEAATITLSGTSPRHHALNCEIVTQPSHGTIEQAGSTVTYIPDLNYSGTDSFTYKVDDLVEESEPATVSISVAAINDAPWVNAGGALQGLTGIAQAVSGAVEDVDLPAQTLEIEWTKISGPGEVEFASAESPVTTATFSAAGSYILRLSAFDGALRRSDTLMAVISDAAPALSVTLSADLGIVDLPGGVQLSASVTGTADRVEFYEGSRLLGEDNSAPFQYIVSNLAPRTYQFTAVAVGGLDRAVSSVQTVQTRVGGDLSGEAGNGGSVDASGSSGGGIGSAGAAWQHSDSDGDGVLDWDEDGEGSDPYDTDSDGDGAGDWDDQHASDERRSRDVPAVQYAVLDISAGSATTDVSLVALGDDNQAAFAAAEGESLSSELKVFTWDLGTAGLNQTINLQNYEETVSYGDPEEDTDVRLMLGPTALLPSGKVYGMSGFGLFRSGIRLEVDWYYTQLFSSVSGLRRDYIERGATVNIADYRNGLSDRHRWVIDARDNATAIWTESLNSNSTVDPVDYEDDEEIGYPPGAAEIQVGSNIKFFGRFIPTKINSSGAAVGLYYTDTYTSSPQFWDGDSFSALPGAGIGLNDTSESIALDDKGTSSAADDEAWFMHSGGTDGVKIIDLVPERYRKQIKEIKPRFISNRDSSLAGNVRILFDAQVLEGSEMGTWHARTFLISVPHDLDYVEELPFEQISLPAGVDPELKTINRNGILAAIGKPNGLAANDAALLLLPFDLDIDSDNNNGYSLPTRSQAEERVEDRAIVTSAPGKLIIPSIGDRDHDGVPDYADGSDVFDQEAEDACAPFIPMILHAGAGMSESATYTFTYAASDPEAMEVVEGKVELPSQGLYRIWKRNGDEPRDTDSNYIAPGVAYTAEDLGLDASDRVTLFVEAVGYSGSPTPHAISVEVAIGAYGVSFADTVLVRSFRPLPPLDGPATHPSSASAMIDDMAGPLYRKIALNGRPLRDGKPQTTEETDEASEETYIDALSLRVNHSTTDVFIPLTGNGLALSVRRNMRQEVWNDVSGLRPDERPDRPFGAGWTSNITPSIQFVSQHDIKHENSMRLPPPNYAYVTDENGSVYRFLVGYSQEGGNPSVFFPLPSQQSEQETFLHTLKAGGAGFIFKKKFGTEITFEAVPELTKDLPANRLNGKGSKTRYEYARATEVKDRFGNVLTFNATGATLIPTSITANGVATVTIAHDGRKISSITDPRNKTINYSYNSVDKQSILSAVVPPLSGSGTRYRYSLATENDQAPREPRDPLIKHKHLDVAAIIDPNGTTFAFGYAFNDTVEAFDTRVGYYQMCGLARNVVSASTSGSGVSTHATFSNQSEIRIGLAGPRPVFDGERKTVVTDAVGEERTYEFLDSELTELDSFRKILSPDEYARSMQMLVTFQTLRITHDAGGTEEYTFDPEAGMALASSTDLNGNVTTWEYGDTWDVASSYDFLSGVADPFPIKRYADPTEQTNAHNDTKTFEYHPSLRVLTQVENEEGHVTDYEVHAVTGLTTRETVKENGTDLILDIGFEYTSTLPGFLTKKIVRKGTGDPGWATDLVTSYTPTPLGWVETETVAPALLSLTTTYGYDANGNKVSVTDPRNKTTGFTYDDRNRISVVTYPGGAIKQFFYDFRGNKTREVDERGHATLTVFDGLGRPIRSIRDMNSNGFQDGMDIVTSTEYNGAGSPTALVDALGRRTTTVFDGFQRPVQITNAQGHVTTLHYENNSGSSSFDSSAFKPTRSVDPRGYVTEVEYDDLYRPVETSVQYGAGLFAVSSKTYDGLGNVESATDPLSKTTAYQYDGLNRLIVTTYADSGAIDVFYTQTGLRHQEQDELGRATDTQYDSAGRVKKVLGPSITVDSVTSRPEFVTGYDDASNVISLTDALGHVTTFTYDDRNRKVDTVLPEVDLDGVATHPTITTNYDAAGNVTSVEDANGNLTETEFDAANRPYRVTSPEVVRPNGTSGHPVTETTYDKNGNIRFILDANGHTTENIYDSLNRLRKTIDANGIDTEFEYDQAGNRTKVLDGKNQATTFQYDGLNRNTRIIDAVGKASIQTYNAVNLTQRTDSMGRTTDFTYDDRHRPSTTTYNGTGGYTRTNEYDLAGRLLSVDEPGTLTDVSYTYDTLDRVQTETSNGVTHTYRYDLAGNRTRVTYGGTSRRLDSEYDAINRLSKITEDPAGTPRITRYFYDLNGNILEKRLPNGDKEFAEFDALNRRTAQEVASGAGGGLYEFAYRYDFNGNLVKLTENYLTPSLADREVVNTYENNNRLAIEAITTTPASGPATVTETIYEYDDAGNRTSKSIVVDGAVPQITSYSYNSLNQLESATGTGLAATFGYDFNGNRTVMTRNGVVTNYAFDPLDRLLKVDYPGTDASHRYRYDYRTRRVERHENATLAGVGGIATKSVFSGGTSVQEIESNVVTVEYIRGSDMGGGVGGNLYTIRGGVRNYAHANARGDIVTRTDHGGAITWQAAYEAYGKRTVEYGSTVERQKANSKEEDPTGLLNEGFRYRDLEFGVWLTRDPAGFIDGPNLYAYVRQNPWSAFDPLGLQAINDQIREEIADDLQRISDEVDGMDWSHVKGSDADIGSAKHEKFRSLVEESRHSGFILTEQSLNGEGGSVNKQKNPDRWPEGSRRPDVMVLNNSEFKEKALKGGGFKLAGKVDSVFDLKTGNAALKQGWVDDVAKRLGVRVEQIMQVGAGGNLRSTLVTNMARVASTGSKLAKGTKYLGWGGKVLTAGMTMQAYEANASTYGEEHALKYTLEETINPLGFHSGHMVDKQNDWYQAFWGFFMGVDPSEVERPHKY